ncbi:hypothetical protein BGZ49_005853 [Haplosporangium sp. Z 27]|nr:hypothetical protein BGZ49_005853 [Haplosporangium sp. Z 27]
MLQASSLGAFAYSATIMHLQHDYHYENTTFNCASTYDYRFVLNADNSTDIYYVASCYFLDGKNTTFTLEANTVVPNITYGWDADLQTASCLAPNTSCLLESLIFYDGDTDPDKVVMVGLNVDPKGNISAYVNQDGYLDSDYEEPSTIPLLEYFQKKRSATIDFTYAEKNVFQTAYSCLDCSTTSAWKIVLGLLTVLSSLGATAYSILISIAEKLHTEQPDTTTITTTITEKKLHQAISAITNLDDMI